MRLNKIYLFSLIAMGAMTLSSCLKDQEDIFEEPSNIRMQETLENTRKVLTSSEEGWLFDYYPDRDISYGGYLYTLKFTDTEVTVGCELAPGETETSLYKFTEDNGPTLSFDTYNSLMHFFATPSGSSGPGGYEAFDGDFEFMIMDVTNDLITLRGKRTGNTMYLHRLNEDAAAYIDAAYNISENLFITAAKGTIGTTPVDVKIYLGDRSIEMSWGEGEDESAWEYFLPTKTGVRFIKPLEVKGSTIETLEFDTSEFIFTGSTTSGDQIAITGEVSPTYSFFEEYLGDFTITFNSIRKVNVTIEGDKASGVYTVKGINPNYDVKATFNKSEGVMEICSQQVAVDSSNGQLIWFCMWGLDPSTGSGSITWDTTAGVYFVKDLENEGTFNITSNGYAELGYPPNSFALYYFTGSVGGSPRGQAASKWRALTTAGTYLQMTYLETMVKR